MGIDQAQQGRVAAPKDLMNCWLGQMTCGLDYSLVLAGKFRDFIRNFVSQLYFVRANRVKSTAEQNKVKSPTLKIEGGAPAAFLNACCGANAHYQ